MPLSLMQMKLSTESTETSKVIIANFSTLKVFFNNFLTGPNIFVPTPLVGEELYTQIGLFCSANYGRSIYSS